MLALALSCLLALPTLAKDQVGGTGLPIPRFVSLHASKAKLRTGPGFRYPVDWIFQRENMPVEIIAEFDTWRKIRDHENTIGWVHQNLLSGRRTGLVTTDKPILYASPTRESRGVAQLQRGVIISLKKCDTDWCKVSADSYTGWIERTALWGVYPQETLD